MGTNKLGKFKILSTDLKFKSRIVDVYTQKILTPDSNIVEWIKLDHKGACAILPIKDDKIILIKQYRNNIDDYVYEIPAGGLNEGEDRLVCAVRELEEETGYKCKKIYKLFDVYSSIGICNELITYYVAEELFDGKTNFDEDEFIETYEFTIEEIKAMINNGTIKDGKTILAVNSYLSMIKAN